MSLSIALILFGAGLIGGIASAIAGGASLVTFPAMLAAGLPPVVANASNAVAMSPSHLMAALADREKLPDRGAGFYAAFVAMAVAGAIGALLLLLTSERMFTLFVPALIGIATLLFVFGKSIQTALPRLAGPQARTPLLALVSIYGGYFGAGLGVILLAVIGLTGDEDARAANALKNVLSIAVSVTSVAFFAITGMVSWPETVSLFVGAAIGGYLGGRLVAVLPARAVRSAIIVTGIVVTLASARHYWMG